ncbi:MAG: ABC transporter permease [Actinomycetota bacterium]|jgi:putative spermidine/putrescine transport system permease protein
MTHINRSTRVGFRFWTVAVITFLWVPLAIVTVLSFNRSSSLTWPPTGFTTKWWAKALHNPGARDALFMSLKTAVVATLIALVLGTAAAFAVQRFKFFGRESLSLMIVLPIALPGIVTGIALNAAFRQVGLDLGIITLIVAHATFCVVVVYNNVLARLRRLSPNLEEASADLGADLFQTFWLVTFPLMRSALLAGGLLAFGLSFDEIVVTTFTNGAGSDLQTLPQWILSNLSRGEQQPIVNVMATAVMLFSLVPVWAAQRLAGEQSGLAGR